MSLKIVRTLLMKQKIAAVHSRKKTADGCSPNHCELPIEVVATEILLTDNGKRNKKVPKLRSSRRI
jgi:hypothetical protein